MIIYCFIGFILACWYVWQLGGPESLETRDLIRVFSGWFFLWPIILGFIIIWKGIERLSK